MADITKRAGDCDGEGGEGERGERGKRGHRGPPGPGGPATSLVGPMSGDGAIYADEDIPPGSVVAAGGSAITAIGNLSIFCQKYPDSIWCKACLCRDCTINPFNPYRCGALPKVIGVASAMTLLGQPTQYVIAGPLTLDASVWDARTGSTGGLLPNATYYLSTTTFGGITNIQPTSGYPVQVGIALSNITLDVGIVPAVGVITDDITIIGDGSVSERALSVAAYGFATGVDFEGQSTYAWQTGPGGAGAAIPGTPIVRNLIADGVGQDPASATAWLTSQVIGLSKPPPPIGRDSSPFISGGIFELTEAQWNAVWTAADPNRGSGSGLLPGYPYYLSDVPGTFFLIDKTGTPPVASGNYLVKCFVALSSTYAIIQIDGPRQIAAEMAELPVLFPVFVGTNFTAVPGFVNQVDCSHSPRTASLPAAASVPNGTLVDIKKSNRADGQLVSLSTVLVTDTIDGWPGQGGQFLDGFLSQTGSSVLLVSDGISNWTILAVGNDAGA